MVVTGCTHCDVCWIHDRCTWVMGGFTLIAAHNALTHMHLTCKKLRKDTGGSNADGQELAEG